MSTSSSIKDRELERQGVRQGRSGVRLIAVGALAALPGLVLLIIGLASGPRWLWEVGIAIMAIFGGPAVVGSGLLLAGAVSRWAARHRSFA